MRESSDAGHYLCDFIYYGGLAESERQAASGGKQTKVLFVHCPPVDNDLSTEYVVEALKALICRVLL